MTTVVGLDPSLAGTGVAVITYDPGRGTIASTHVVTSSGKKSDTRAVQARRTATQRNAVMDSLPREHIDHLVIEGISFGSNQIGHDRIVYLWWLLYAAISQTRPDTPITVVQPSSLKKITTGSGAKDPGKKRMEAAVTRMWPAVPCRDDNARDALALAAIGAVHLRLPVPFIVTEDYRLAMAGLDLPARPERTTR
ncbi:hypothetical protein ACLQ3K_21995 [Tsukamurella sp. DT100]|uniref:hypothetical protein n=1 Tax=Tsukamurella sp. DT100 TaxID=3393415 RepID=UPI003CF51092